MMQKGMSAPILLIAIALVGAGLYASFAFSRPEEVRGASNSAAISQGFSVLVTSPSTWDFYEYLCTSLSECEKSLTSGVRYSVTSGGQTAGHEIVVAFADSWKDFEYIKVFARPGWGAVSSDFDLVNNSSVATKTFTQDQQQVDAAFIPISNVSSEYIESLVSFSAH